MFMFSDKYYGRINIDVSIHLLQFKYAYRFVGSNSDANPSCCI